MEFLLELRRKITDKLDALKKINALCETENRAITDAEQNNYDKLKREIETMRAEEDQLIKDHALGDQLRSDGGSTIYSQIHGSNTTRRVQVGEERSFRGMFADSQMESGGFESFGEFVETLASRNHDPRLEALRPSRRNNTIVPSEGGFLVPPQFLESIFDTSLETELVRNRARVFPMRSQTLTIPAVDGNDHTGGQLFGGFTSVWINEGGTNTRQTPKFRSMELKAKKNAIFSSATREMVRFGINFEQQLSAMMRNAVNFFTDQAYLFGDGVGKPLGALSGHNALIVVAKETGQAADTILFENIVKMWERMPAANHSNSVWVANSSIVPQLFTMSLAVGTGGVPVFVPASEGATGRPNNTLFGRPILFSEKVPLLGDQSDISLVDFSQYAIGLAQEVIFDVSNAPQWTEDKIDFRTIVLTDGQPLWSEVRTPINGQTQSPFVTLAARA